MSESRTNGLNGERKKRRGVRASRIALERALGESGLAKKTQAALADRIADLEGLDAAPKDLVSRVFRERPVDLQTLDRVARALGADTKTLLLGGQSGDETAPGIDDPSPRPALPDIPRGVRTQIAALFSLSFILFGLFIALAVRPAGPWCGVREFVNSPRAEPHAVGIMVARFAGDQENRAQQTIVAALAADPNLAPHISVVATCARPRLLGGAGEIGRRLGAIRRAAQKRLARAGAHVLVWGEIDGGDIIVRYVSLRRDEAAQTFDGGGKPLKVNEDAIEVRIRGDRPNDALADVKRLALELSAPEIASVQEVREAALSSFAGSADWLRAAVLSQKNLRRTINRDADTQYWATVNMRLCRDLRLLGDFDFDPANYAEALEACDAALSVRPRDQFPYDWTSIEVDKASSIIRQHYFAARPDEAVEKLRQAQKILRDVVDFQKDAKNPRAVTARRNLGVVHLRLGELLQNPEADASFQTGVDLLMAALKDIDPAIQPLDWAITQQNICLSLYQRAIRLGGEGEALAAEAKARCADAVRKLQSANAPLDWAMAQNNLAAASAVHAQLTDDAIGLENARSAFAAAQAVYTEDRLPNKWAEVELNLGELSCNLAIMKSEAAELEDARTHLDRALAQFIERGNARYRRYAEGLVAAVNRCDPKNLSECACG